MKVHVLIMCQLVVFHISFGGSSGDSFVQGSLKIPIGGSWRRNPQEDAEEDSFEGSLKISNRGVLEAQYFQGRYSNRGVF